MTEYSLRISLGLYIVLCQIILLFLVSFYFYSGGFLFSQFTTIIGLIVPLFAGYLSIIIKFFTSSKYLGSGSLYNKQVSVPFIVLSFFFPSLLTIAVASCIYAAALNLVFRNFEDVKIAISLAQGAFGIYVGQFVYSLFEEAPRAPNPRRTSR